MRAAGVRLLKFGVLVALLLLGLFAAQTSFATTTTNPWEAGTPEYGQTRTILVLSGSPAPAYTSGNNIECTEQQFGKTPEKRLGPIVTQATNYDVCAFKLKSGWGAPSGSGQLYRPKNAYLAGAVTGPAGVNGVVQFIPHSNTIIEFTSGAFGAYVKFIDNAFFGMQVTESSAGAISYKTTAAYGGVLKNKSQTSLMLQTSTMSFSENGEWMIADSHPSGFIRVNTKTREVLPFASGFSYGGGYNPFTQTAISNNGRYAIVSSSPQGIFKLYDLNFCGEPPNSTPPYTCKPRDLHPFLKSKVPTLAGSAERIRFKTNDTFSFFASYDVVSPTNKKIGQFMLTTPSVSSAKIGYLAMGDSFAAGEGAYDYKEGTNIADNRCHQSEQSYPYLIAEVLSTGMFRSVACSGAKIKDVMLTELSDYNNSKPQVSNKSTDAFDEEIYQAFLPGYRGQLNFVDKNTPEVVTISIGGNDIGFSSIIANCVTSTAECFDNYEERLELVRHANSQFVPLKDMFSSIKSSSAHDAKVYVIGYPQIAVNDGNCALNVHFSYNERVFGNQLVNYLNMVVRQAADAAGVKYVDTEQAFAGHRLCETDSKNVAVNGLTFSIATGGGPVPGFGPIAKESYHPNRFGHQLFRNTILQNTSSFTAQMPTPTSGPPNLPAEESLAILNAPKSGREVWQVSYDYGISNDIVYEGALAKITANYDDYALKPNGTYNLVMYSTPTDLGTVTANANGNIDTDVLIPTSLDPGYHTLHIRGVNINDEKIDITKIVYVAATVDDMDGDGTSDAVDACVGVSPSGIDVDADGKDDACDEFIDEAPLLPPTEPEEPTPPVVVDDPEEVVVEPPTYETPPEIEVEEPTAPPEEVVVLQGDKDEPQSETSPLSQQITFRASSRSSNLPAQTVASTQSTAAVATAASTLTTQQPVTSVQGSETKEQSANETPTPTTNTSPVEISVLIAGIGLLALGVLAILWKLNKKD